MSMVDVKEPGGLHGVAVVIDLNEFTIVRAIRFKHRKLSRRPTKFYDDLVSISQWLICHFS